MPVSIIWEKYGAQCTYSGEIGFLEFSETHETVLSNENFCSFRYVIHDVRSASFSTYSEESVLKFVAQELGAHYTNEIYKTALIYSFENSNIDQFTMKVPKLSKLELLKFETITDAMLWFDQM